MVQVKVLIAYCTGEQVRRPDFYDYIGLLEKPKDWILLPCHDRSPAKGRNLIIEAAFEHECTHILLVDDDMAPKPEALLQLLEHDVDIVSGLYYSRAYPHQPLAFDLADEDTGACLFMYMTENQPRLKEVVCTGFGFCLMKTSIFSKLEKPYVRLGELDPENWCDDVGFFNRVRKAGIKIYVDTECRVGHMGTVIIWPSLIDGKWHTGYDTNGLGMLINVPQIMPEAVYNGEYRNAESKIG